MAQSITLGFNIALIAFIVFGAVWGIIRGLKRTTNRLLFMLILSVIVIFITIPITTLILKIPVNFTMTNSSGVSTTSKMSILEIIGYFVKEFIGESFVDSHPEFTSILISLPVVFANTIVYLILFWVFKYLLYPLDYLIYRLTLGKKKKQKEVMGFADFGDDEEHKIQPLDTSANPFEDKDIKRKKKPEYHSSDQSIEPLRELYENSQKENENISALQNQDLFLKNNNNYNVPTATAEAQSETTPTEAKPAEQPKLVINKDKRTDKYKYTEEKEPKNKKPSKHRLWGGLVGVGVGLLVMFNTMIPVSGFINILSSAKHLQINHLTEDPISTSQISGGLTDDIIKGYELSVYGRLSRVLYIEDLALSGFDQITTQKTNGNTISLRKDIDALVKTANSADKLVGQLKSYSEKGLENITQAELDSLMTTTNKVLENTEKIGFVNAISKYAIPIVVDILENQGIKFTKNELINDLILSTLKDVSEDNSIVILNELKAIVDIANYLNEQKVLLTLVSGNTENIIPTLKATEEDFGANLSNKIFAIKSIDKTLPNILNVGIQLFDEIANIGYNEDEDKNLNTQEEIKSSFVSLIDNIITTAQSLDTNSPLYLSYDSFVPLGKTLNTLRNSKLFNLSTYNKLVNFTTRQLKGVITAILPENLQAPITNNMLNNVVEVQDWEEEMTIWSDAIKILRDKENGFLGEITENNEYRVGYSTNIQFNENTFNTIGLFLDKLETTTLLKTSADIRINSDDEVSYKGTTLVHLFSAVLNELKGLAIDSVGSDSDFAPIVDIVGEMRINLIKEKHLYTANSTFWQNELNAISPLLVDIYNTIDSGEFTLSSRLGQNLDQVAKNSVMLGSDATWKLMSNAIDLIKDTTIESISEGELKNSIVDIFNEISTNLNDPTYISNCQAQLNATPETGTNKGKYWEVELEYLMSLADIADKSTNITTIAGAKDIASDLDKVYKTSLISNATLNKSIAVIINQLKTDSVTGIDGAINTTISSIAEDLKNNSITITDNFWQNELNYIEEIMDIDFNSIKIKNATENDLTLTKLGAKFDNITGKPSGDCSQLLTEDRIRKILSNAISPNNADSVSDTILSNFTNNEIKTIITTSLTDISNNIGDTDNKINSFEKELGYLQTLANIEITSSVITDSSSENMTDLLKLGKYLDNITYNVKTDGEYVVYDEDKNSSWITRSTISTLIADMFEISREENVDESNTQKVAYNKLIDSIKSAIEEKGTNYVYQWQTELKFVGHLLDLKKSTELATNNIGKPLDAIAFNIYKESETSNAYSDIIYEGIDTNNDSAEDLYITKKYPINGVALKDINNTEIVTNSIFLSRELLRDNVSVIFDNFKESGVNEGDITVNAIKNDLLDNVSTSINTSTLVTDNSKYNTFTEAFTALENLKTGLTDFHDLVNGKELSDIDSIAETLDTTLATNQNNILYGVKTTRKLALLITNEIIEMFNGLENSNQYTSYTYLDNLKKYYKNNLNSTDAEVYYSNETNEEKFFNPFVTYSNKYNSDKNSLFD